MNVLVEHECPRCHRDVELPLGALCPECVTEIEHRSSRFASLGAALSTVILAIYVTIRMPPDDTARLVGVMSVGIWFVISRMVFKRTAREWFRSRPSNREL